jgi:hypothetical protein
MHPSSATYRRVVYAASSLGHIEAAAIFCPERALVLWPDQPRGDGTSAERRRSNNNKQT